MLREMDVPLPAVARVLAGTDGGAALREARDRLEADVARRRRALRLLERVLADGLPGAAVTVAAESPDGRDVLPGGTFAAAMHVGPYEAIPLTVHGVLAWFGDHGHVPVGPVREVYVSDPATTPPDDAARRRRPTTPPDDAARRRRPKTCGPGC